MVATIIQYLRLNPLQPIFSIENPTTTVSLSTNSSTMYSNECESERTKIHRTTVLMSRILKHWGKEFSEEMRLTEKNYGEEIIFGEFKIEAHESFRSVIQKNIDHLCEQQTMIESKVFLDILEEFFYNKTTNLEECKSKLKLLDTILPIIIKDLRKLLSSSNLIFDFLELNKVMITTKNLEGLLNYFISIFSNYYPEWKKENENSTENSIYPCPPQIQKTIKIINETVLRICILRNYIRNDSFKKLKVLSKTMKEKKPKKRKIYSSCNNERLEEIVTFEAQSFEDARSKGILKTVKKQKCKYKNAFCCDYCQKKSLK